MVNKSQTPEGCSSHMATPLEDKSRNRYSLATPQAQNGINCNEICSHEHILNSGLPKQNALGKLANKSSYFSR